MEKSNAKGRNSASSIAIFWALYLCLDLHYTYSHFSLVHVIFIYLISLFVQRIVAQHQYMYHTAQSLVALMLAHYVLVERIQSKKLNAMRRRNVK
jgi:hypothetical protein